MKFILDSIQDRSSVDKKESELDKYRSQIKKNLKKLNKDKKFFENNENCPTCEQDIDETFKRKKLLDVSDDIEEMDDGLDKLQVELDKVYERIKEISDFTQEMQSEESQVVQKTSNIQAHNNFIRHLSEQLETSQEDPDVDKSNLLNRELEKNKITRTQYTCLLYTSPSPRD